jgi:DNA-3-methyladenine glycosylase
MLLVHRAEDRPRVGRVVATEAYLGPPDLAAHSTRGRHTEVMIGPLGPYLFL